MRLLLDTHGLIWYLSGDARLPTSIGDLLENPDNQIFVSLATVWEMSIKEGLGKLGLKSGVAAMVHNALELGLLLLPIELPHVLAVQSLPPHHGDPFDRLLIAQANTERLTLVSRDAAFDAYAIPRLW